MPHTGWTEVVALVAEYLIAVITTPVGISGAVLLLPFQVTVLATPSPSVTPTNLLYNVVATPGALRDHVHDLVPAPAHLGGAGLADRYRSGRRGPGRRVYRCSPPVPDA